MSLFFASLRHAFRGFLRAPGFTVTVLLTLALGIGANSAVFSVTRALLLKPLPFHEPERLVALWGAHLDRRTFRREVSAPNFFDWRDAGRSFEHMALFAHDAMDLAGHGENESIRALRVTSGYFELLRVRPLLGRTFTREDEAPQAPAVALLKHGLWQRRFGGDPAVVGQTLILGGRPTLVIGVLPPNFRAPTTEEPEIFTPFLRDPTGENRGMNIYEALARLKPGASLTQARSELDAVARAVSQQHPEEDQGWSATVVELHRHLAGDSRRPLLLLQGSVILLLLIACANLTNLLLVREAARLRESAVRDALGASLRHHVLHHLSEGLILSFAGALLGLLLAKLALGALPILWAETNALGILRLPSLDSGVLVYTFTLTLSVSLIFGLVPLLQLRKGRLQPLMTQDAQSRPSQVRLRSLLVLAEVALATLLVLESGLLLRSFFKVAAIHPGFETRQVIAFRVGLPDLRYPDEAHLRTFNREIIHRLENLPGADSATACGFPPLLRNEFITPVHLGPTELPASQWSHRVSANLASPDYLRTLRIPLLQGRDLSHAEGAAPEALVNAAFVRTLCPTGNPLGKRFQIGLTSDTAPKGTLFEIVGVMGDHRSYTLETPPRPAAFLSMQQVPYGNAWYLVRSRLPLAALAAPIRAQVAALDSQLAVRELTDLDTFLDQNLGDRRQPLLLLGAFSALALILAALGIHGVVAFTVAQRTREIGLRMALGADVVNILRLVFRQGMTPVLLGCGVGLAAFAALHRLLSSQLYGIQASDPLTLFLTLGLLSQAALLACLFPALGAARVQPAEALRSE